MEENTKVPRIVAHEAFAGLVTKVAQLDARACKLRPYSHVNMVCGTRGWSVYGPGIYVNAASDPFTALSEFEAKLSAIENQDANLAATLGIDDAYEELDAHDKALIDAAWERHKASVPLAAGSAT